MTGTTGEQGGSVAYALLNSGNYNVGCLTCDASSPKAMVLKSAGAEVVLATWMILKASKQRVSKPG